MAAIEERVAFVEGRIVEQFRTMTDLRDAIVSLERRMDERFAGIDHRLAALDARLATQFLWVVGLQVTTIVGLVTAVLVR